MIDKLRDAYKRNADVNRFCAHVQDNDVVVTPSARLETGVHEIIDRLVHH